jgi:predicted outer membrane repeat protein
MLCPVGAWSATTYTVDPAGGGNFTTIGAALASASVASGDTVRVMPGQYAEYNLSFGGKDLTLQSVGGAARTVIDCQAAGPCFRFQAGETEAAVLDGFTLQNGQNGTGGAMLISGASPRLQNLVFSNNSASGSGGAIFLSDGAPLIRNTVFFNNSAAAYGGAMEIVGSSAPTIVNSAFVSNSAQYGGAIDNDASTTTVDNSVFWDNSAVTEAPQVYNYNSAAVLNLRYNDIQGGIAGITNNGTLNDLGNNFAADPGFKDLSGGNLHLVYTSPLIDAGLDSPAGSLLPRDLDGVERLAGAQVDIGPYEYKATLTVAQDGSGDFDTIQGALDAASHYSTVLLADGIYRGAGNTSLYYRGQALSLRGVNGAANVIIDCEYAGRGLFINGTGLGPTTVEGVTIRHCKAPVDRRDQQGRGGAIYARNARLRVVDGVLEYNHAETAGGGVFVFQGTTEIRDTVIRHTTARDGAAIYLDQLWIPGLVEESQLASNAAEKGGALFAANSGVEIIGSRIEANVAVQGGGVYTDSSQDIAIDRTAFIANIGTDGGALFAAGDNETATAGNVEVTSSLFSKNVAFANGGGMYAWSTDTAGVATTVFEHCTFVGNSAFLNGGALLFNGVRGEHEIRNAILWGNGALAGGPEIAYAGDCNDCADPGAEANGIRVEHSIVGGGLDAVHAVVTPPRMLGGGPLTFDPLFALADDFRLAPDSPAIDAGAMTAIAEDLDGRARDLGTAPDLGAYESLGAEALDMAASPARIEWVYREDGPPPEFSPLTLRNIGAPGLSWEIEEDVAWLGVDPAAETAIDGLERGSSAKVTLIAEPSALAGLQRGLNTGWIRVRDTDTGDVLRTIEVALTKTAELVVEADGSGDYPTIQAAIDAAVGQDVVLVGDGDFSGPGNTNIRLRGKQLTVRSRNGPAATAIDVGPVERGFVLDRGETNRAVIQGFRFNVDSSGIDNLGIGVYVNPWSSISITNCEFSGGSGNNPGRGIQLDGSFAYIANNVFENMHMDALDGVGVYVAGSNNTIYGNTFRDLVGKAGTAVTVNAPIPLLSGLFNRIWNNTFLRNQAVLTGNELVSGGAILTYGFAGGTSIRHNTFVGNRAAYGGAIVNTGQGTDISNSVFYGNEADVRGGAVADYANAAFPLAVTNNTFVKNATRGTGGAVWTVGGMNMTNSLLWYNVRTDQYGSNPVSDQFRDETDIYGWQAVLDHNSIGDVGDGPELVSVPAKGADGAWGTTDDVVDLRLRPGSPAIDAGTEVTWLFSDIRGSYRPVDGNDDGQSDMDIGAYEYSRYYGGIDGDQTAKAFSELGLGTSVVVTDFEVDIRWKDRDPFPLYDDRVQQAGEYEVRLLLVDDSDRVIELLTDTVPVTQLGYALPFTFGAEHIGTWRLRLELVSDPNQYLLSDRFEIAYKQVDVYALAEVIPAPDGADPMLRPDVDNDSLVYWSAQTQRLFAIGRGPTLVTWYADEEREDPIPTLIQVVAPELAQVHVADTQAVPLLPADSRFDSIEKKYASNDASISGSSFTARTEGWSVLLFRDADALSPFDREHLVVVRTLDWDHAGTGTPVDPMFPNTGGNISIGSPVTDPGHSASCGNGYVLFETSYYDGYGENRAYDRASRTGPILPVNEDLTGAYAGEGDVRDDLVVVWYEHDDETRVCWPYRPVHYNPVWPVNPPRCSASRDPAEGATPCKITIASQLGSGPLVPETFGVVDDMLIYRQPDPALPGYNPNEEHAAFFTAQGSEYPAVFPLRNDLNRADTSDAHVILKYRDPLSMEWRMTVFEVRSGSGRYRLSAGAIVDAGASDERYCLDAAGVITPLATCSAASRYHLDGDGHLVKTDATVGTCFAYLSGSITEAACASIGTYHLDAAGVLMAGSPNTGYAIDRFGIIVSNAAYHRFHYTGTAGNEINAPYPLNQFALGPCSASYIATADVDEVLRDKDEKFFSYRGGVDIGLHYFYKLQPGFHYDGPDADLSPDATVGTCLAWLDRLEGGTDEPVESVYEIRWPDPVPTLFVGETLVSAKTQTGETIGLPEIGNQCQVDILFDEPVVNGIDYALHSVNVIDPLTEHASTAYAEADMADPEADLPNALKPRKDLATGRWVFTALPYHVQSRLTFDEVTRQLKLKGVYQVGAGEPLLLLNTLSEREMGIVSAIVAESTNGAAIRTRFGARLDDLNEQAVAALRYPGGYPSVKDAELKALTAGDARGTGYVTLAFNNHEDCSAPTVLSVLRVDDPLYEGEIKVIESPNPFEEKVTLRHSGDFGGQADSRAFQWKYTTADFSGIPCRPDAHDQDPESCVTRTWYSYAPIPAADLLTPPVDTSPFSAGAVDTVIQGTGQQLLPDKWFSVRYHYDHPDVAEPISLWTKPQLYEGWIKRVMKKINLFDQKVADFHAASPNTTASMIDLAGQRYEGDVALSDDPDYLQNLGIIEVYETLLSRGEGLTEDGGDFADLNKALLFAANRVADLYMLLGNEAYADAADPTIGFSTESGVYGTEAPAIFSFQNQVDSLLDEERALLHGRDDAGVRPFYNRLAWNFTLGDGEVAYKESYNITDQDEDGDVDEYDAMALYPQGHGDAWGQYLSAIKTYYRLFRRDNFTWIPQSEAILVAGTPVQVDYRDERKFATAAAARARTGAEIVNLAYRRHYTADPDGQWQGYKDVNPGRAWGVDGWARRAGQGALFDWVVGNALLPAEDSVHEGIAKVDRTTVLELGAIADSYSAIETEVDSADAGLNPLGLAHDVVPFDIDPNGIASGDTHFEQIYGRAVQAMNNAIAVFDHANESSQLLRRQQDSLADFQRNVESAEADFNNRLVEVFGYPYPDDCGPNKTYPTAYCETGPDLYHYMYVDASELMGTETPKVHEFEVTLQKIGVDEQGVLTNPDTKVVTFHVDTDSRFGIIKPAAWNGRRKSPGETQIARSDLLQIRGRFEKGLLEYQDLLAQIELQSDLLTAQNFLNIEELTILGLAQRETESLNARIHNARSRQLRLQEEAARITIAADAAALAVPQVQGVIAGFSNGAIIDALASLRGAIRTAGAALAEVQRTNANEAGLTELDEQQSKEILSAETNLRLTDARGDFAIQGQLLQLENLVRKEPILRHELYVLFESLQQSAARYLAVLARGDRLLKDRLRFRQQTAAQIIDYRYKDMSFRIFRNAALAKYRAQFDMAARYVYLAAKAYDYETTLLDNSTLAGERFLTDIVRQRTIGMIENGQPLTGSGLADPMKRMWQNFQVLKPQLGFNNPQRETNRFSLRQELFRIRMDAASNATWRQALSAHRVDNLWDVPEYRRYCRPFGAEGVAEPGLVIPFSTTVTSGLNYFRWPLGGGDSYYSSSNFATKVRSAGVWLSNYNSVGLAQTPRVYLVPVGEDVLRTPSYDVDEIRTWHVVDQKLPTPFPITKTEMAGNPDWIPTVDTLFDTPFEIRRHSDFRAYHDSGYLNPSEMVYDSRLVGRSVWNDRWLLIIPGRNLLYDPGEGLDTLIDGPLSILNPGQRTGNGISDIKLFFETYSYSGN